MYSTMTAPTHSMQGIMDILPYLPIVDSELPQAAIPEAGRASQQVKSENDTYNLPLHWICPRVLFTTTSNGRNIAAWSYPPTAVARLWV